MSTDARKPHTDRDGVRVFEKRADRRGVKLLAIGAVMVIALGATALLLLRRGSATRAADDVAFPAPLARPPAAARAVVARPLPKPPAADAAPAAGQAPATPAAEPARGSEDYPPSEEERRRVEALARDVIDGLRASGETSGLAAFPPPGTEPLKIGIVVPKSFVLPEGYVRHYQITDDGQRLEPILMFSPTTSFATTTASSSWCRRTASFQPPWRLRDCRYGCSSLPRIRTAPLDPLKARTPPFTARRRRCRPLRRHRIPAARRARMVAGR